MIYIGIIALAALTVMLCIELWLDAQAIPFCRSDEISAISIWHFSRLAMVVLILAGLWSGT